MSEVRALLLTDVVDSTGLTERLGDAAMAALWARHDEAARDLLAAHRGREIDKTDGFLLLFDEAEDAVEYAAAYHRVIATLDPPLQARAGIHVGPVVLRENPAHQVARGAKPLEVEGIAKPTAARVMSAARAGQTLLSEDAFRALSGTVLLAVPAPDGSMRGKRSGLVALSHGHWQMQGVSTPLELFEVGQVGEAPFTPPPDAAKAWRVVFRNDVWQPAREVPHYLPAERDAFVGRENDLLDIAHRLGEGARLLSVIGIGGAGKTRLVTHYGWTWLGAWPGGVWFCDLAEARSADGIVSAVARALDVPLGKDDPVVQLGHAIAARGKCLVILDNFEQVAQHARATLGPWLDRADRAQFVVTSREVLGLRGEDLLDLSPLPVDEGRDLFTARAVSAKRGWSPSAADGAAIDALVTLLDGLPLAIELAAARVRMIPVKQIHARMSDRFRLLAASGAGQDRQATLRAAIDGSWDLLAPWEKAGLAQSSAFEGGFALEAAEAVFDLSVWPDAPWPMDVVQALIDKSLIRQVTDERFGLLVSIHEYASEKLRTPGSYPGAGPEAEQAAWMRHGEHYAGFGADEAIHALRRHGGVAQLRALSLELGNVVAGCRRATVRGDNAVATALLRAAWEVLDLRGPFPTGLALAEAMERLLDLDVLQRAHVARVIGRAGHFAGQPMLAEERLSAAVAGFHDRGDLVGEAVALHDLGYLLRDLGRLTEARDHLASGLTLARKAGNRPLEAELLCSLGNVHQQQGRLDEAGVGLGAALDLARAEGDRPTEGRALEGLAIVAYLRGRLEEAHALFSQSVAVSREVGDRRVEGIGLGNLGEVELLMGRKDESWAHIEAALSVLREVGDRRTEGYFLGDLGTLHHRAGRLDEARDAFQSGERILRETQNRWLLAILLGNKAGVECDAGDLGAARVAVAEAEAIIAEMNAGPDSEPSQIVAKAKARLGELER